MVELDKGKAVRERTLLYPKVSSPSGRACSKAVVWTQGAATVVELTAMENSNTLTKTGCRLVQEAQHSRRYSWGGKVLCGGECYRGWGHTSEGMSLSVVNTNNGVAARGDGTVEGLLFREDAHST